MPDNKADAPLLRVISLGAGVQSSTMSLMASEGLITPMPDCAIFSDTQWEPRAVYEHLERLEKMLPFPVHRVTAGNIKADIVAKSTTELGRFSSVPWHLKKQDGEKSIGKRQCTKDYKLVPIARKQRELLGAKRYQRVPAGAVEVWLGISLDEAARRMKPARNRWQKNRWPLVELRMDRQDCIRWLASRGLEAPRSACLGCPFHSDDFWRNLRKNSPGEWGEVIEIDRLIRNSGRAFNSEQYVHKSLTPLEDVDLRPQDDITGQQDLFGNECEGMCGL